MVEVGSGRACESRARPVANRRLARKEWPVSQHLSLLMVKFRYGLPAFQKLVPVAENGAVDFPVQIGCHIQIRYVQNVYK